MLLSINTTACGQDNRVESSSYALMLNGLLSHTVEEAYVADYVDGVDGIHLLDAREKNEFEASHINGATWVGYDDFNLERVEGLKLTDPILVYCSVGYRSEKIGEKLEEAGFSNVKNLYGGIFEWMNQDGTVVDSAGNPTKTIHAFDKAWGVWLKKGKKVYK